MLPPQQPNPQQRMQQAMSAEQAGIPVNFKELCGQIFNDFQHICSAMQQQIEGKGQRLAIAEEMLAEFSETDTYYKKLEEAGLKKPEKAPEDSPADDCETKH